MTAIIENQGLEIESFEELDALKSLIMDTILESTDQLSYCVISFAYVAIQKYIAYCKDHSIDPLTMSYDEIKAFVDQNLMKEVQQELKTPIGIAPIG